MAKDVFDDEMLIDMIKMSFPSVRSDADDLKTYQSPRYDITHIVARYPFQSVLFSMLPSC